MKYEIAIPSFKRPNELREKTLKLLETHNIDRSLIKIFLRDEEELKSYNYIAPNYNYVLTGCKSICEVRNHLKYYYYEECTDVDYVLYIDDDIDDIYEYVNPKLARPIQNLEKFIIEAFTITDKENLSLWGIAGLTNPFFMKDSYSKSLKYIMGGFSGEVIRRDRDMILCDFDHFEDVQFSCEYFLRDGGVIRFQNIGLKTVYFGDGGINETYGGKENRLNALKDLAYEFCERYGDMCRAIQRHWGYMVELNWRYKL